MSELLVIGIVALIVIGPKDLPEMFRQLGRLTAKMRTMAREFSRAMEQAAQDSGVSDVAKDLRAVTDPKSMGLNAVKDAVDKFEKWDPIKNAAKPTEPLKAGGVATSTLVPPPMPATPVSATPVQVAAQPADAQPAGEPAAAIGPNTAALYEKKAAKAAILRETTEKLKALDQPAATPEPAKATPKPKAVAKPKAAAKPKAGAEPATATPASATPASATKAPRKKKAAEE